MSTASSYLTVAGINVDVVHKDIKNLHIGVYPPLGRVRVAAPARLDEEQIRLAVVQRLSWIKRKRKQLQDAERQSEREMVTGETHHVWGVRHRLTVVERPGKRESRCAGQSPRPERSRRHRRRPASQRPWRTGTASNSARASLS